MKINYATGYAKIVFNGNEYQLEMTTNGFIVKEMNTGKTRFVTVEFLKIIMRECEEIESEILIENDPEYKEFFDEKENKK